MSVATSSCPRLQSVACRHPRDDRNPLAMEFIGLDPADGTGHSVVKMGGDAASCRSRRSVLHLFCATAYHESARGEAQSDRSGSPTVLVGCSRGRTLSGSWSESACRVATSLVSRCTLAGARRPGTHAT